jgi:hypothetical protein
MKPKPILMIEDDLVDAIMAVDCSLREPRVTQHPRKPFVEILRAIGADWIISESPQ